MLWRFWFVVVMLAHTTQLWTMNTNADQRSVEYNEMKNMMVECKLIAFAASHKSEIARMILKKMNYCIDSEEDLIKQRLKWETMNAIVSGYVCSINFKELQRFMVEVDKEYLAKQLMITVELKCKDIV